MSRLPVAHSLYSNYKQRPWNYKFWLIRFYFEGKSFQFGLHLQVILPWWLTRVFAAKLPSSMQTMDNCSNLLATNAIRIRFFLLTGLTHEDPGWDQRDKPSQGSVRPVQVSEHGKMGRLHREEHPVWNLCQITHAVPPAVLSLGR